MQGWQYYWLVISLLVLAISLVVLFVMLVEAWAYGDIGKDSPGIFRELPPKEPKLP